MRLLPVCEWVRNSNRVLVFYRGDDRDTLLEKASAYADVIDDRGSIPNIGYLNGYDLLRRVALPENYAKPAVAAQAYSLRRVREIERSDNG